MATLSSAARLPVEADVPRLRNAMVEQTAVIIADFDALAEEAKAYRLLTSEIGSLRQIVDVVTRVADMSGSFGLKGAGLDALHRLGADLEGQLGPLETGARRLDDAFAAMEARMDAVRPSLVATLAAADQAPIRAPGALIGLRHVEASPESLADVVDAPVALERRALSSVRAEALAVQVTAWAGVSTEWIKGLVVLRVATDEVLIGCRLLRRHLIILSDKDVRTLSRIGALADQAAVLVGAVQLLKDAMLGAPPHKVVATYQAKTGDALQEVLDAAVEAVISADGFLALADHLNAVADHISDRWMPGVDGAQGIIESRRIDALQFQMEIERLLTDELPSPSVPFDPPSPPPPPGERSFLEKIGGWFSSLWS